jgi:hypothetical protein
MGSKVIKVRIMREDYEVGIEIRRAGLSVMMALERWGINGKIGKEGTFFDRLE